MIVAITERFTGECFYWAFFETDNDFYKEIINEIRKEIEEDFDPELFIKKIEEHEDFKRIKIREIELL